MKDMKSKRIGNLAVVLHTVPAREALLLQRYLGELMSVALGKGLALPATGGSSTAIGASAVLGAVGELLTKLDDEAFMGLVERMGKYIYINGKPLDIDGQFTAETLLDLYEALAFFLAETFGGFFAVVRSRFPKIEAAMSNLSKAPTSTGISGGLA